MLTSKQLSFLKKKANTLKPVFQIGKDGMSDNMINDIISHLRKNELMKISILPTSSITPVLIEDTLFSYGVNLVQSIGRVVVLYMKSEKALKPIVLPD